MGHIFFITPSSPGSLDKLNQWTFRWLLEHGNMADDSTLYTCNSIESAQSLLESALIIGQSPALIIFDHADHATEENLAFSKERTMPFPNRGLSKSFPKTCRFLQIQVMTARSGLGAQSTKKNGTPRSKAYCTRTVVRNGRSGPGTRLTKVFK